MGPGHTPRDDAAQRLRALYRAVLTLQVVYGPPTIRPGCKELTQTWPVRLPLKFYGQAVTRPSLRPPNTSSTDEQRRGGGPLHGAAAAAESIPRPPPAEPVLLA